MANFSMEIPRPRKFLYLMSLRTGAELITTSLLINKVSGVYGILALFTGYELSPVQLSMYIYSILALILTLFLFPGIRTQDPLRCLALAFLYAIDTAVNTLYTATFAVSWFLVLAGRDDSKRVTPGGKMMNDTAGFTNPDFPADKVEVVPTPRPGLKPGEDALTVGVKDGSRQATGLGGVLFESAGLMSISTIAALWALRVYFVFVMLAFARRALRQHIASTSSSWTQPPSADGLAENPFAVEREEGQGWKGEAGRRMLKCGTRYWLGADEEGEWARGVGGRFRKNLEPVGLGERERRRRSGTGPPAPPPNL